MGIADRETSPTWAVHRQDDNGNRFVVRVGLPREEAARLVAELEARGHKQLYWIEAGPTATGPQDARPCTA